MVLRLGVGLQIHKIPTMPHNRRPDKSGSTQGAQQSPPRYMSEVNTTTMNNRGSRRGRGQGQIYIGEQRNNRFKLKPDQVYHQNQQLLENVS